MPELSLTAPPPRAQLVAQLRGRLVELVPSLRVLAEGLLGAESRIDFVAADPDGRAVLALVGEAGEDLELVGRAIAQRRFVEPRLRDWLQLNPGLGVRPEAGVAVWLLAPAFRPEARAAAEDAALGLATYRAVRNGAAADLLVEKLLDPVERAATPDPAPVGHDTPPAPFRTGLTDADLDLTDDERREFD